MIFKVENKLPHVNQLLNVFFAFILFSIFQNMAVSPDIHRITVIFVLAFFTLYAWWRQNDVYLSSNYKNAKYLIYAGIRIVLVVLLVNLQRDLLSYNTTAILPFVIIGGLICLSSIWQFRAIMLPTYGKIRVFLRREIWTDTLFLGALVLLFLPVYLNIWPFSMTFSFGVYLAVLFVVRIVARAFTRWKEAAPPHRGGKGRSEYNRSSQTRRSTGRSSIQEPRSSRPTRPGTRSEPTGRPPKRSSQDAESQARKRTQSKPKPGQSPARSTTRVVQKTEKSAERRPESRRQQNTSDKKTTKPARAARDNSVGVQSPVVIEMPAERPVEIETKIDKPLNEEQKNRSGSFGKRNAKPKRPKFAKIAGEEPDNLHGDIISSEGETEITFGRAPKKKSR